MPDPSTLLLFMAASAALVAVPGPAVLYIVGRGIAQGRAAGVVSALGDRDRRARARRRRRRGAVGDRRVVGDRVLDPQVRRRGVPHLPGRAAAADAQRRAARRAGTRVARPALTARASWSTPQPEGGGVLRRLPAAVRGSGPGRGAAGGAAGRAASSSWRRRSTAPGRSPPARSAIACAAACACAGGWTARAASPSSASARPSRAASGAGPLARGGLKLLRKAPHAPGIPLFTSRSSPAPTQARAATPHRGSPPGYVIDSSGTSYQRLRRPTRARSLKARDLGAASTSSRSRWAARSPPAGRSPGRARRPGRGCARGCRRPSCRSPSRRPAHRRCGGG